MKYIRFCNLGVTESEIVTTVNPSWTGQLLSERQLVLGGRYKGSTVVPTKGRGSFVVFLGPQSSTVVPTKNPGPRPGPSVVLGGVSGA